MYIINLDTKKSSLMISTSFTNNYLYKHDDVLLIIKDRSHRFSKSLFHRKKTV